MSLLHEVLGRIQAILQRKMLIETKNRTLNCLKRHYSTVRSMKNVAVLTEDEAFPSFSFPPRVFASSRIPTPGNLPSKAKKCSGASWGGGLGTAGIGWCIILHSSWVSRSFYSCRLSTLAFKWMWGWGWPCFDKNLLCFATEIVHKKY